MAFNTTTLVMSAFLSRVKNSASNIARAFGTNSTVSAPTGNNAAVNISSGINKPTIMQNQTLGAMFFHLRSKMVDSLPNLFSGLYLTTNLTDSTRKSITSAKCPNVAENIKAVEGFPLGDLSTLYLFTFTGVFFLFGMALLLLVSCAYFFDVSLPKDFDQVLNRLKRGFDTLVWINFTMAWLSLSVIFSVLVAHHTVTILVKSGPCLMLLIGLQMFLKWMLPLEGVQIPQQVVTIIEATTIPYPSMKTLQDLKQRLFSDDGTPGMALGKIKTAFADLFALMRSDAGLGRRSKKSSTTGTVALQSNASPSRLQIVKLPFNSATSSIQEHGYKGQGAETVSRTHFEDFVLSDDESDADTEYSAEATSDYEHLEIIEHFE